MRYIQSIKAFVKNKDRNYVLLSQVFNALIALILGKLIAIYIVPEDFGLYNLQFASYTFFATLIISPFLQFIKASNTTLLPKIGSKPYFITISWIALTTYLLIISFMNLYYEIFDITLYLLFLIFIPLSIINSVLGDYFNTTNKLIDFSILSVLRGFSGLVFLSLFFILGLTFVNNTQVLWVMNIIGILTGLIFYISKYPIYKERFKIAYGTFLKKYVQFSGPLVFLALWAWINNYFDRFAIDYFLSMKDVGIYNANYGVGSKFFLLLSPVFMVLLTPSVYAVVKKEVKKRTVNKYGLYYFVFALPILGVIYYLKDLIGSLLLSDNYKEGFYLIFWIALAFFLLTLTQLYELIFYAEQKTKFIMMGNMVSAILNILLNIMLIPVYGILGAAVATCVGFAMHLAFILYNFKKL